MPRDEIVGRRPELPPSASAAVSDAPGHRAPRNRLLTVSLIVAVCLTQAGWLGILMWGLLWLFGTA
jgi:hypothetical protein